VHVAEQPSPSVVLPSSQASLPPIRPSPQVVTQTDGSPLQVKPCSIMQVAEQPSPDPERYPCSRIPRAWEQRMSPPGSLVSVARMRY